MPQVQANNVPWYACKHLFSPAGYANLTICLAKFWIGIYTDIYSWQWNYGVIKSRRKNRFKVSCYLIHAFEHVEFYKGDWWFENQHETSQLVYIRNWGINGKIFLEVNETTNIQWLSGILEIFYIVMSHLIWYFVDVHDINDDKVFDVGSYHDGMLVNAVSVAWCFIPCYFKLDMASNTKNHTWRSSFWNVLTESLDITCNKKTRQFHRTQ